MGNIFYPEMIWRFSIRETKALKKCKLLENVPSGGAADVFTNSIVLSTTIPSSNANYYQLHAHAVPCQQCQHGGVKEWVRQARNLRHCLKSIWANSLVHAFVSKREKGWCDAWLWMAEWSCREANRHNAQDWRSLVWHSWVWVLD